MDDTQGFVLRGRDGEVCPRSVEFSYVGDNADSWDHWTFNFIEFHNQHINALLRFTGAELNRFVKFNVTQLSPHGRIASVFLLYSPALRMFCWGHVTSTSWHRRHTTLQILEFTLRANVCWRTIVPDFVPFMDVINWEWQGKDAAPIYADWCEEHGWMERANELRDTHAQK